MEFFPVTTSVKIHRFQFFFRQHVCLSRDSRLVDFGANSTSRFENMSNLVLERVSTLAVASFIQNSSYPTGFSFFRISARGNFSQDILEGSQLELLPKLNTKMIS
jgi:hypothetical protein